MKISIVMYHYVREIKDSKYPRIRGLEFSEFKRQIDYFEKNYQVIRMEDVLECFQNPKAKLPENAMLLTFDDGYKDHYQFVFPYLQQKKMQGSFFMPAMILNEGRTLDANKLHFILEKNDITLLVNQVNGYVDELFRKGEIRQSKEELYKKLANKSRWDDKDTMYVKRLLQNELPIEKRFEIVDELFRQSVEMDEETFTHELYMNLEQMKEMKEAGMYFGIHGYDHLHLGDIPLHTAMEDITKALDYYRDKSIVDTTQWVMNFPYGSYQNSLLSAVKKEGCVAGLGVRADKASLNENERYALPRFDTNDFKQEVNNAQ